MVIDVSACFQCGKCSAGCPVGFAMDILPHQIVRLAQLAETKMTINSEAIWLCNSCGICLARCPRAVDLPKLMKELRAEAYTAPQAKGVAQRDFYQQFLAVVECYGRVPEPAMITTTSSRTRKLTVRVSKNRLAIWLRQKNLFKARTQDMPMVSRLFQQARMKGGGKCG